MINQAAWKSGLTKIYYFNRWGAEHPFIHMSFDGQQFTTQPLKASKKSQDLYKISIPNCFHLQFVFCNKDKTRWDNPSEYCSWRYKSNQNFKSTKDGCYVVFDHKLLKVPFKRRKSNSDSKLKLIVITDLDKTLYGDDEQMAYFNHYWLENFFFHKDEYLLVYCTGRSAYSTHRLLANG